MASKFEFKFKVPYSYSFSSHSLPVMSSAFRNKTRSPSAVNLAVQNEGRKSGVSQQSAQVNKKRKLGEISETNPSEKRALKEKLAAASANNQQEKSQQRGSGSQQRALKDRDGKKSTGSGPTASKKENSPASRGVRTSSSSN